MNHNNMEIVFQAHGYADLYDKYNYILDVQGLLDEEDAILAMDNFLHYFDMDSYSSPPLSDEFLYWFKLFASISKGWNSNISDHPPFW